MNMQLIFLDYIKQKLKSKQKNYISNPFKFPFLYIFVKDILVQKVCFKTSLFLFGVKYHNFILFH